MIPNHDSRTRAGRRRLPLAGAALVILLAPSLAAQGAPAVPAPDDGTVAAVLEALQTDDAARRGAVVGRVLSGRARVQDSARVDGFLASLHAQGAPFSVDSVTRFGRSALLTVSSPSTARRATLRIATDREDPSGLGTIDILEAHPAVLDSLAWPSGAGKSNAELAGAIEANMARAAAADAFSGVVYVLAGDSVIFGRAYGYADREHLVPNQLDTRFAMASMSKMFTAVAVLRLVERGLVRLDDTLARVLPAYPNAERAQRITIRHLLEHTAGLGSQWGTPRRPVPGLTGSLAIAGAIAHAPLLFEPGTRWSYSNEGYTVLAAVIEHLSGEAFTDFVQREVLEVAGMRETALTGTGPDAVLPRRAVGYRPAPDDLLGAAAPRANWTFLAGANVAGGAGGGYTTAADLARFGKALRSGRLLSQATLDSMWTGRWDIPGHGGQRYGWGAFTQRVGDRLAVGHGGGGTGSGMDNGFRHFTDGSYTIVVLTNIDPPAATLFTNAIVSMLGTADGK